MYNETKGEEQWNKPRPMNAHNSQEKRRFSCRGDFTMSRTLRSQDKDAAGTLRNTVILKFYQVA